MRPHNGVDIPPTPLRESTPFSIIHAGGIGVKVLDSHQENLLSLINGLLTPGEQVVSDPDHRPQVDVCQACFLEKFASKPRLTTLAWFQCATGRDPDWSQRAWFQSLPYGMGERIYQICQRNGRHVICTEVDADAVVIEDTYDLDPDEL